MSECVCLCVCRLCIGHLAELCCHFWCWAAALSSYPEYWQGEQSVLAQRNPAFACDFAFILYHIQKTGANANLDSVGETKNTLYQMTPTALGSCTCCAVMFTLHRKYKNLHGWQLLGDADPAFNMPFAVSNTLCISSVNLPVPHVLAFLFLIYSELNLFLPQRKTQKLPCSVCMCMCSVGNSQVSSWSCVLLSRLQHTLESSGVIIPHQGCTSQLSSYPGGM